MELDKDDLMDLIMAYNLYIQDSHEKGYFTPEQRPLTIDEFYTDIYNMYSSKNMARYMC